MNIKGEKITLRAIEEADLPLLHIWYNDPDIAYQLGGWHFPTSLHSIKKWYEGLQEDHLNQRFAVETETEGFIGTANLIDIDWKNNHAFHGMLLGNKDIRGKGHGRDTIMTIMRYAFDELHLERLDGSMIEYNEASLIVYVNKCGWKEEGRQKNWYFRKGRYWDKVLVGITSEDYKQLVSAKK